MNKAYAYDPSVFIDEALMELLAIPGAAKAANKVKDPTATIYL